MKLYLDDVRPAPSGWELVTDGASLLALINQHGLSNIEAISFDNDLGSGEMEGHQVLTLIEAMVVEKKIKTIPEMTAHSANPVARRRMMVTIERIETFAAQQEMFE
jgi:hypothetical protein